MMLKRYYECQGLLMESMDEICFSGNGTMSV